MPILKRPTRSVPTHLQDYQPGQTSRTLQRASLRTLENADASVIHRRLTRKWLHLAPITGVTEVTLRKLGFRRCLGLPEATAIGIRPWTPAKVDRCFHIQEMVAGLEWRLRQLIENPAQVRIIDGQRVVSVLGSLVVVRWPSGQLGTYGWEDGGSSSFDQRLSQLPPHEIVLQGMPWKWLWLSRVMKGFELELREELNRRDPTAEQALHHLPQAFESYLKDVESLMRHRLCALPAYRHMRQRIRSALDLDPIAMALTPRIAEAPAHLKASFAMVSTYNLAVQHRDLLQQVQADAPQLFTFYTAMLEDWDFPTAGEPLTRLRTQLYGEFGQNGPWRLLLATPSRCFVLMRCYVAALQHENFLDWLRLLHLLSPSKPIPMWLLKILIAQFGAHSTDRGHPFHCDRGQRST